MNPEKLHDALDLLDEDLITPAAQLRGRRNVWWPHIAALAACLAVVCMLGVFSFSQLGKTRSNDTAQELGMVLETAQEENGKELPDSNSQSVTSESFNDCQAINISLPSAILCIEQMENDRFTATVLQSEETLATGERVTVLLTEDTALALGDQQEASWSTGGQQLYEGASVVVFFVPGPQKGTVYAAVISFAE